MSKVTSKSVNIFLALDKNAIIGYFNPHDTSPIYKRQLGVKFEQYIRQSVKSCKRYDPIFFKLTSNNRVDEQFSDPLMYAIRRHFTEKRNDEVAAFTRFKRRNYGIILVSLLIVAILNFLLPSIISKEIANESGLTHFIDVFSFVIFYHPLTELLFNWNPFLKRIHLLNKILKAEAIIIPGGDKSGYISNSFDDYESVEEPEMERVF